MPKKRPTATEKPVANSTASAEWTRLIWGEKSRMTATVVSRAGGGAGLGLAIAKHLVQAHGGEIGVETGEVREGTTFYFTLPPVAQ